MGAIVILDKKVPFAGRRLHGRVIYPSVPA